jgi:hypothetical protein
MYKYFAFLALTLMPFVALLAQSDTLTNQDNNISWNKIPEEDLKMTVYTPDSSAHAVVLAAKGHIKVSVKNADIKILFRLFRRVKLLKKSAFDSEGNITISCYSANNYECVLHIRASVIQPDGSREQWSEKDFYIDKTNSAVTTYKFACPKLQEGSIIQYEYDMETKNLITLHDWTFQEDIPVRHSELNLSIPFYKLKYAYIVRNPKYIQFQKDTAWGRDDLKKVWVDSIPALKQEAYITTMSDYLCQIRFQLNYTVSNYMYAHYFLTRWKELAEKFINHTSIGKQITKKSNYNAIWQTMKPLILTAKTDDEKIKIIYTYLCENISWDDSYSIFSDKTLNEAFRKKKANSGELNLMLLACLSEAKIKATPMLISTRTHGKVITLYPIQEQFNHLVAYIERADTAFIIDVGNVNRPVGTPRLATLNEQGWLLDNDNPRWLPIVPTYSSEAHSANVELSENGTLKGSIASTYEGYAATNERDEEGEKQEKTKKKWAKKFLEITIDSTEINNLNNTSEPFKRTIFCTIPNAAVVTNSIMYIKPTLQSNFDVSPFKQLKRDYPIDFTHPIRETFVLNMTFPKDYVLEEMPKAISISLLKNSGSFDYSTTQNENSLQITVKIQIAQLHFEPEGYGIVKGFFDQIAAKLNEQIVLKKKS